jgi:hypothetical protein
MAFCARFSMFFPRLGHLLAYAACPTTPSLGC